jgi:EAL domain-containing protein (putative c-di-GMP-specific phosphodiesterase class I)
VTDEALTEVFELLRAGNGRSSSLIDTVLEAARTHLEMDVSLLSEFQAGQQLFRRKAEREDARFAVPLDQGVPLAATYCQRVVAGQLSSVVADARHHPVAGPLPATELIGIGAYVGVPVHMTDGRLYGTLCCVSREPDPDLRDRDARFLAVLADIVGGELSRNEAERTQRARLTSRVETAIRGEELTHVFQPIVALETERVTGFEALARFAAEPERPPNLWFAEAWEVGLGVELELHSIREALARLADVPDGVYLSLNASPQTVATPAFEEELRRSAPDRVQVEVTEHAVAEHYELLREAMGRLRALGVRFAVDDVGAGYAGLNHLVAVSPDVIKLDRFLISGVDRDPARQALAGAAAAFAERARIRVIAEGIETPAEHEDLRRLGIRYGQGFHFARPGPL